MPDTGVTRHFNFTIARASIAPDGVQVAGIVVNGQYPGPLIEANWGDWIEVNVYNEIWGPEDLTSIHWHGFNQQGTPYYDGVATVSHCPIVPGTNLTYRFRADEYGTSWYHSHYSAQYSAGVHGPIVIHGPDVVEYDVDLGPISISDWFHDSYDHLVDLVLTPTGDGLPFRPFSDSNLVGGAGQHPCANVTNGLPCTTVPYASYEFQPGKTHRLRIINTGASAFETVSIDGHTMTVIANDFVPVQPYETPFVTPGSRPATYNSPSCGDTNGPDGRGIIYYSGIDPNTTAPSSTGNNPPPANPACSNDPLGSTVPAYAIPAAATADTTITLTIGLVANSSGVFHWTMNGASLSADVHLPARTKIYNTGTNGTVRLIVINTTPAPHPMHIHGHDFQVLAEGQGQWDGSSITNPSNPQRRDTQMLRAAGANATNPTYIVHQYGQDNPGIWPFHCHIAWHLSAGMGIMLLERPADLAADVKIPAAIEDSCTLFQQWQTSNPTTDVDDGLRRMAVRLKRDTEASADLLARRTLVEHEEHGHQHHHHHHRRHTRHLDRHNRRSFNGLGRART
ncbi:oxidoreductase ptaK [Exophiala dermatitidis]